MTLDTGYVRGVSSLSPMFHGGNPAKGPMDSAPNRVQRAFCLSCVRGHSNRFLYSTGPQRRNRWRAVAPEDTLCEAPVADPGGDACYGTQTTRCRVSPPPLCMPLLRRIPVAQRAIPHSSNIDPRHPPCFLIKSRGRKGGATFNGSNPMSLDRADRWLRNQERRNKIDARKLARAAQQKRGLIYARQLKAKETKAERLLRLALIEAGYWFRAQSLFFDPTTLYIPDFILKLNGQKLVIEVDGPSHATQRHYDAQRTEWMRSHRGCVVARFTNEQVITQLNLVMRTIAALEPKLRFKSYRRSDAVSSDQQAENCDPAEQFKRFV